MNSAVITVLNVQADDFDQSLQALLAYDEEDNAQVRETVRDIIADVRVRGDEVLLELTNRFDARNVTSPDELCISKAEMQAAYESIDPIVRGALEESAARVRSYHQAQLGAQGNAGNWQYQDELGNSLGQRIRAMQRVGIYTPGGKAAYPSTILMTAIPARVAGVEELILCVPTPGGEVNEVLLAAAHLADIDQVFSVGGAQAVAAMAYGTDLVPAVNKIVGPGNIFVATAKELVFGKVGIDMIAGPSEVVIVADDSANPDWVIQDMFAQAEHDEMAQSILISASETLTAAVLEKLPAAIDAAERSDIIRTSLSSRGAIVSVGDLTEAMRVANLIAPEHLQLAVADPEALLDDVIHAGAVFLGNDTAEVVGDYTAGQVMSCRHPARRAFPRRLASTIFSREPPW